MAVIHAPVRSWCRPRKTANAGQAGMRPLMRPRVSDLRQEMSPDAIQLNINQSMEQVDDSVPPVESFSGVSETPPDWKISERKDDSLISWKDQVQSRKENIPNLIAKKGSTGKEIKKIDAGDLI